MSEELPPSLFNILRGDLRDTRSEINGRLDGLARDMVTSAMLAQVQANQKERDDRQDARIRALETDADDREKEQRRIAEEQRKGKAQQFFSIGLAAFGSVLAIIGGVVTWTVTSGLQQLVGGSP
ncbi:hypothetical protein ILP86_04750 [Microbacterium sp. R1]|uniref:Uncharacterized protein n=1 Tax=Microbacterium phage vB_MoxS-R1 TaxID=2848881 RepID=A0A8F2E500_9CAUD|nr:hypothetical protein [Microbacterium sp. R1]YP_010649944.1 hypothetical protein PP419_gp49 [Microbacterium phage vB_MoxS-R1]MBE7953628.1 hypothetical protein [Microbacterium sp. R1]QWT28914.1 hypothetical protein vBMoxSR1_gp64 [Microbacterium phage vB_MoxS-R1]